MGKRVQHIVIIGGGSAGWIAAARIAARNSTDDPDSVKVTLVESETIGTIGVGEGTWPTMRNTLKKIGISETDFIRQCNGAFKQGAKSSENMGSLRCFRAVDQLYRSQYFLG